MDTTVTKLLIAIRKLSTDDLNELLRRLNKDEEDIDFNTEDGVAYWVESMYIDHYTINDDLTVDVGGDVDISYNNLTEIPVQFNIITGNFDCRSNHLKSLKGCPKECRNFACFDNYTLGIKYLNDFDFSFVKGTLITDYTDINDKWN